MKNLAFPSLLDHAKQAFTVPVGNLSQTHSNTFVHEVTSVRQTLHFLTRVVTVLIKMKKIKLIAKHVRLDITAMPPLMLSFPITKLNVQQASFVLTAQCYRMKTHVNRALTTTKPGLNRQETAFRAKEVTTVPIMRRFSPRWNALQDIFANLVQETRRPMTVRTLTFVHPDSTVQQVL